MPPVRVRVPATSANLGPGFDCLGLALQLHNYVTVATAPGDEDVIVVTGEGADLLPRGTGNIAMTAVRGLLQQLGARPTPLQLTLENGIPLARGLGSSSAARVGALVAANEWARNHGCQPATTAELLLQATRLEGHPDNAAPALLGGLVTAAIAEDEDLPATGLGCNRVLAARLQVERFPLLVVFIPETEQCTNVARDVLPDNIFRSHAIFNLTRTGLLLAALMNQQWELLPDALQDRMHQDHRAQLMPALPAMMKAATMAGAFGATLSGAGPSVLAWLPDDEPELEQEVVQAMLDAAARHEVFGAARTLAVDLTGATVVEAPAAELRA